MANVSAAAAGMRGALARRRGSVQQRARGYSAGWGAGGSECYPLAAAAEGMVCIPHMGRGHDVTMANAPCRSCLLASK